jgi:hypothetical protein
VKSFSVSAIARKTAKVLHTYTRSGGRNRSKNEAAKFAAINPNRHGDAMRKYEKMFCDHNCITPCVSCPFDFLVPAERMMDVVINEIPAKFPNRLA